MSEEKMTFITYLVVYGKFHKLRAFEPEAAIMGNSVKNWRASGLLVTALRVCAIICSSGAASDS